MKKIFAIMVALTIFVAFSGLTLAAAATKTAEPAKEAKKATEKVKQVTGEVTAVDTKANTVTVKGKKGDVTVEVPPDAKITAGKETKTLADVMAGVKVTAKFIVKDGKNTAKSIDVKAAAKKEEKEEPKK